MSTELFEVDDVLNFLRANPDGVILKDLEHQFGRFVPKGKKAGWVIGGKLSGLSQTGLAYSVTTKRGKTWFAAEYGPEAALNITQFSILPLLEEYGTQGLTEEELKSELQIHPNNNTALFSLGEALKALEKSRRGYKHGDKWYASNYGPGQEEAEPAVIHSPLALIFFRNCQDPVREPIPDRIRGRKPRRIAVVVREEVLYLELLSAQREDGPYTPELFGDLQMAVSDANISRPPQVPVDAKYFTSGLWLKLRVPIPNDVENSHVYRIEVGKNETYWAWLE